MSKLHIIKDCWDCKHRCKAANLTVKTGVIHQPIPNSCPLPDADVILTAAKDSLDGFDESDDDMPEEMMEYGKTIKTELKKAGVEI